MKRQAINNLHETGVEIVLVTDIINGINNMQLGRIRSDAAFHLQPILMLFE